MNHRFLILALACLFLQSEARSFRGGIAKFLLGELEQDADDIAGFPSNDAPTHEGDTPHARAGGETTQQTANIIQTEISNGLRKDFQFIRDSITAFADEDGFVREGIIYCGGAGGPGAPTAGSAAAANYHANTGSLNLVDGFGQDVSVADEKTQCLSSGCEEGSFVSLLANRIRALGYHVTHSDICQARATNALNESDVPTARTCKLKSNSDARKAYACSKADFEAGKDSFLYNQQCYKAKDATACEDIKLNNSKVCVFDDEEDICVSNYTYVKTQCSGKDKAGEDIAADGTEVNAVRRVIAYSVKNPGDVPLTDKTYVTGTKADTSGNNNCKSLRQYVSALNGMAQINAFRDVNIEEADANWATTIEEARTFVQSYAAILSNFYDQSLLLFPGIEFEEMEECPIGDVEKSGKDSGSRIAPLCDNSDYTTADTYNAMTSSSQSILRSKCFCRKGSLDPAVEDYEADDFYLSTEERGGLANCSSFSALSSVHQFCQKTGLMEAKRWKDTLEDLEPKATYIKTFGTNAAATKTDILAKMDATLPLVGSYNRANCGRLVSSDGDEMLYSNKGGNCAPFAKLHDVLYRLEFETSKADSGTQRGTNGNFADSLCKKSDKLASTMYTFRQLAYQWDHARVKNATVAGAPSVPALDDDVVSWSNSGQEFGAESVADQLFAFGDTDMCNIDWTEEIAGETSRKDSAGSDYSDPYLLFDREIQEAIFNAEVAVLAKKKTAASNENLWAAIEAELTSVGDGRINSEIAFEAAEHFMRIVTTDPTDDSVDSTDAGAEGGASENPGLFGVCGLQQKAASVTTCAGCGNGAAISVGNSYTATTAAGKFAEASNLRSDPATDYNATSGWDDNTAACAGCALIDTFNDGQGQCNACPGSSTKEVYTSGACDVSSYESAQDVVNNAASAVQDFVITSETSTLEHNTTNANVERAFSALSVECASGYSDANGEIGVRSVGAKTYDLLTTYSGLGVGSAAAADCNLLQDLLTATDQNVKPLTNNLKDDTAKRIASNEIQANTQALDRLASTSNLRTDIGNYLNTTHTNGWQLLSLSALQANTGEIYLDVKCIQDCDGDGSAANIKIRDDWQANATIYMTAQSTYNTAVAAFRADVATIVTAKNAIKDELNTRLTALNSAVTVYDDAKLTSGAGSKQKADAAITALANTWDSLDTFNNGTEYWKDGDASTTPSLTSQAVDKQKEYREEWVDLTAALDAYGEKQAAAETTSASFGVCFTSGTFDASFDLADAAAARGCGTLSSSLTTALGPIGVAPSGGAKFAKFAAAAGASSGRILKDAYDALLLAHQAVRSQAVVSIAAYQDHEDNKFTADDPDSTTSGDDFNNVFSTLQGITTTAF